MSIVMLIIVVILLPFILGLFTRDIDPINDSDLNLQVISIPDKDNAYFDLIKIKDVLYKPKGKEKEIKDMIEGRMWDEKLAEEIISNNQKAFEYFSEASRKPKFQNPTLSNPENINPSMVFPSLSLWRTMSGYSLIKVLYLSKQGKENEAIYEALSSVYIGQKIQESQTVLIEYLVAMFLKERGLEAVQNIFASSNLDSDELKRYAQSLDQFYKNEDGFISIIKGEYYYQYSIIDALVNGNTEILQTHTGEQSWDISQKLKNNYYFMPNKTKALFAGYARKNIENANKFCNNIQNVDIQMQVPSSYLKVYFSENLIGKVFHDITALSLTSANAKKCNEDSLVSATQALIAIKAYKNDNGDYPNSLEQLVPDYLSSVPLDYFDGNLLRYSKENKILYSIGKDLKDDGGSTGDNWKKMTDPTFKINF
ncbi:MAG: hypothetical protein P1P85_00905 [Patescibacteria group bacterium]|nr:hypothetical protein [Patescibacteria group bacterium]